jgi:UDP-N-acetylmuramate--alanine ligase
MTDRVYAHFIGVGGAGMSAIARVLHDEGRRVTGSDLKETRYAKALRAVGIDVAVGHAAENLGDPEVVVVSTAIPETNPEYRAAVERGLEIWPRARMLAELAGERKTIAVAGTHGKTTVSSMFAVALSRMGVDPTFLIGGVVKDLGANAGSGSGEYYVVEADESDGSFLFLSPHLAMVTNVEADHLDFYDGIEDVERIFVEFLGNVSPGGVAVVCADDDRAMALAPNCGCRVVGYGFSEGADVRCDDVVRDGLGNRFRVALPGGVNLDCSLKVPGIHNVLNATGVIAGVWALGLDPAAAAEALSTFGGAKRRFDELGVVEGVTVVDDYAHHPTEIAATLAAAEGGFARVWAVFQPHRYSRTEALAGEFGSAFGKADRLILMDVYSAGEVPVPGVSGKTIVDAVLVRDPHRAIAYFPHRPDIVPYLADRVAPGDVVLVMGAGDVNELGADLVRELQRRQGASA